MSRISGLFLVAASFTLASCAGELLKEPSGYIADRSDFVPVEYRAVIEQFDAEDTKTMLSGNVEDNMREVLWEPGDEILLTSGRYNPYAILKNSNGSASASAVFKGSFNSDSFLAIYPASIVDTTRAYKPQWEEGDDDQGNLHIILPSVQKFMENGIAPGCLPMAAKYENGNGNGELEFINLCGVLVIKLRSDIPGLKVNSIRVRGKDWNNVYRPLSGENTLWRWNSRPELRDFQGSYNDYVDLDCIGVNGEGVDINKDSPVYFHVVIPPTNYNGFDLEIKTNQGRALASSSTSVNIERAKRYFTAGSVPFEFVIDDLSPEETANSYIVSEIGKYKFKATVKGNGSEPISPTSAAVLWESYGAGAAPSAGDIITDVRLEDGYIHFTALKQGNAVIAAFDDAQQVLWSWHIWSTDGYDPIGTQEIYNNRSGIFMDRNLGAMSAVQGDPAAKGLYYQWGRKDPFTAAANTLGDWPTATSSAGSGTVDYSVANPTTFIFGNDANYDWYYTGGTDTDNTRWADAKTMYDPCPPGWKIPAAVWSTAMGSAEASAPELWDTGDAGMALAGKFGGETAWYPGAGAFDYQQKGLYKESETGYYWSSTPSGEMAASLMISKNGTINTMYSGVRSYGMSVRCCRSDFSIPVDGSQATDLSAQGTANSYIVPAHGVQYKFKSTKQGNSSDDIVGTPYKAEVIWESLGTDEAPSKGDVVASVGLSDDGYVVFTSGQKDGNALIALKDSDNRVLWSWHIWAVEGYNAGASSQQYKNSAIMMDRNLGALVEVSDDTRDDGLLYQWGRKDPFLTANPDNLQRLASTYNWPASVASSQDRGNIEYAVANPTTFIIYNSYNYDWYYTGNNDVDNSRWDDSRKTKYDPCPPGWTVPKGGPEGVWASAFYTDREIRINWGDFYDGNFRSADLGVFFGTGAHLWHPFTAYMFNDGRYGSSRVVLQSASPVKSSSSWDNHYAYQFSLDWSSWLTTGDYRDDRSSAKPVRCVRENSMPAPKTYISLSSRESANSYIVTEKGRRYSFTAKVRGNGSDMMSGGLDGRYAEVLWESNGRAGTTNVGDVVTDVEFKNGEIRFTSVNNGNAVIALKEFYGNRNNWSWHIWVSEGYDPEASGQVYGGAGMMMDRNLGAISASKGDAGSFGLLYQWGRKDPFLGSADAGGTAAVSSSVEWPSAVGSSETNIFSNYDKFGNLYSWDCGNSLDYSIACPMTFIKPSDSDSDWYVAHRELATPEYGKDRWKRDKTIYDPCPPGWRVVEGGETSLWAASGVSFGAYDPTNGGYSVNSSYWYPLAPVRSETDGALSTAYGSTYWASPLADGSPYYLQLTDSSADTSGSTVSRGRAGSVRCCKIGFVPAPDSDAAVNLSKKGTANSYIANSTGTAYQFYAKVRGNSEKPVPGTPAKAVVIWETFGTADKPEAGDVVSEVSYSNGYISFKAGKDGNALIAVTDASDNILWSWHIWVCNGYDADASAQVYNNGAGTFMDRNLGATTATPGAKTTNGLFYQWGRKDPFIGSVNAAPEQEEYVAYTGMDFEVVDSGADHMSAYSFAHPTSYITSGGNDEYRLWNECIWARSKNENDPCPPGWRVPAHIDSTNPYIIASGKREVPSNHGLWDQTNYGWNLGSLLSEGNDVWYPATGRFENNGNWCNYQWEIALWLTGPSSAGGSYSNCVVLYGRENLLYFDLSRVKSDGNSVRCVKE